MKEVDYFKQAKRILELCKELNFVVSTEYNTICIRKKSGEMLINSAKLCDVVEALRFFTAGYRAAKAELKEDE